MMTTRRQILNHLLIPMILLLVLFTAGCGGSPAVGTSPAATTGIDNQPVSPTDTAQSNSPTPEATAPVPNTGLTPSLTVSDQEVVNGAVKIDEVVSSGPGWVVIYAADESGQPGDQIGHTAVKEGTNTNLLVAVGPQASQGTFYVLLHSDHGAVGTYEYPGPDAPVLNGIRLVDGSFTVGAPVDTSAEHPAGSMEDMSHTPTAPDYSASPSTPADTGGEPVGEAADIIVANQPILNGSITIPQVITPQDSWLVIHRINGDGSVGAMVGYAHVPAGDHKNVVVPLDTNNTSTTMSAMLHVDTAKASTPQFPGPDAPLMIDGVMLNPTFQITQSSNADVVVTLGATPETQNYLVDATGLSLYISLQDAPGKSNCTGECLNFWRPIIATGRIVAGAGIDASKFGVITLPNGTRQVTYANAPLYRFSEDKKPGDVKGQGMNGNWYLVTP